MRLLAGIRIVAGETGASGLAGLLELLGGNENAQRRAELKIDANSRILVFITEGVTDPVSYAQIVR